MTVMKPNELLKQLAGMQHLLTIKDLYKEVEIHVHIYYHQEKNIHYKVCFKGEGYLQEVTSIEEISYLGSYGNAAITEE
jgi:hypothetical protein